MPQPVTGRFQVYAQLANSNSDPSPFVVWLKLHAEYWPVATPAPGQPPCVLDRVESAGAIAAGASWTLAPEDVLGRQPGTLAICPCVQFQCTGSIDLTLLGGDTQQTRVQLYGRGTNYNFTWVPSGDPRDPHALIRDNSIVPGGQ